MHQWFTVYGPVRKVFDADAGKYIAWGRGREGWRWESRVFWAPNCTRLSAHAISQGPTKLEIPRAAGFLLLVFSWISFPPAQEYSIRTFSNVKVHHRYQRHLWQIFPPDLLVLLILVATNVNDTGNKFAAGVNDTGVKQWEKLSNCWQLKMNLKKKMYLYANSTTPKVSRRNNKKFSDWRFFSICHRCHAYAQHV